MLVTIFPLSRSHKVIVECRKMACLPIFSKGKVDFDQICTGMLLRHGKELIRFW